MTEALEDPILKREFSYRSKLLLSVCALVLLTGGAVTFFAFRGMRSTTTQLAGNVFREVSAHTATQTRNFVLGAVPLIRSLEQLAGNGVDIDDSDKLAHQLLALLRANPGMSWISFGDRNGTFTGAYRTPQGQLRINQSRIANGRTALLEQEVQADGTWKVFRQEADTGYDPRTRAFYIKAAEAHRLVWLPPYVFYEQGVPGITCADPIYKNNELLGVFTVDFDLNALSNFVSHLSIGPHSQLFLFTSDGLLLAHPTERLVTRSGQRAAGELLRLDDVKDPLIGYFQRALAKTKYDPRLGEGFNSFEFTHEGNEYLASVTKFQMGDDLSWAVGALAPSSDFLGAVRRNERIAFSISAAAVLLALLPAAMLSRRVSGPILSLIDFMHRVGKGDLDARASFGGSREFTQLSNALNHMIENLRDLLRLRTSVRIAKEVQQRLLPMHAPKVPGLDIAGHSTYCDETGGDYYDFLVQDESPGVMLVVGDVTGHGVGSALVMAGVRAVLRDRAARECDLADLMGRLNSLLAADLDGSLFMTMHLSSVDPVAGTFKFASAGHDPAMIFDPASDQFIEIDHGGLPLGVIDSEIYESYSYGSLRVGQVITVGTDGIWEAPNTAGEFFGKDRLRDAIRATANGSAAEIAAAIVDRLNAFRGAAHQKDDVTFIVVKLT